jgi:hypothetical protein
VLKDLELPSVSAYTAEEEEVVVVVVVVEVENNEPVMKHWQFSLETDQRWIFLDALAKKVEMVMVIVMNKVEMKVVE